MEFIDQNINELNLNKGEDFYILIIEYLCGHETYKPWDKLPLIVRDNIEQIIPHIDTKGVNYQQFNEILLLLGEDRVSEVFFNLFFKNIGSFIDNNGKSGKIDIARIKKGVVFFRGVAMLFHGNFRHCFKDYITIDNIEVFEIIFKEYAKNSEKLGEEYKNRLERAIKIKPIEKQKTFFNGYLSKKIFDKEMLKLKNKIEKGEEGLQEVVKIYDDLGNQIQEIQEKALYNTDVYLTWDFMDVYIATSMRNKWEFEETFDFIKKLFSNTLISDLNLRYFDPTMSNCINRINKGIVEGLMLKRAKCTIYMIQETDTLGKDSELAATLAQGKPVIAFIPEIDEKDFKNKILNYPLEYFKKRIYDLYAEEIFDNSDFINEMQEKEKNFQNILFDFIKQYDAFRSENPFSYWTKKEEEFRKGYKQFELLCEIISKAEKFNFNKRADIIKNSHPLSFQVHLDSGVANGVLVVRKIEHCAKLLKRLLTNDLKFTIKKVDAQEKVISIKNKAENNYSKYPGLVLLVEDISECPFRVVSSFERLSNSFWNFYLNS